MSVRLLGWGGLIVFLCISTFGLWWCVTIILSALVFLLGGFTLLYLKHGDATHQYSTKLYQSQSSAKKAGASKILLLLDEPISERKLDKRLTGSHVIDESLQEVLGYILRDHVTPWYERISTDPEFTQQLRHTAQTIIVSFSNRMKEVDWIPYLTTRLVDDAASHLRLFRAARAEVKRAPTQGEATVPDLEAAFFDLELAMERNLLCRDRVCTEAEDEAQYLRDVGEVLLFLLLPATDFTCLPLRFLLRELLASVVVAPLLRTFSDPDYLNQTIIWLCRDVPLSCDSLLAAVRSTDSVDELVAVGDLVNRETAQLRSRDSGGEDDTAVKQQLGSLSFVRKVLDTRMARLQQGNQDNDQTGLPSSLDWVHLGAGGGSAKLFALPLEVVLKNNIALSYFIDYATAAGVQAYLFFYLNVEGWRASASQQASESLEVDLSAMEAMRSAARAIFDQYLGEKAGSRLRLDENAVRRLRGRIAADAVDETWFDPVRIAIVDKLQLDERFLPGFRASSGYVRLLAELDLLKDGAAAESDEDSHSLEEVGGCLSDDTSLASLEINDPTLAAAVDMQDAMPGVVAEAANDLAKKSTGPFVLSAEIIETGVVSEGGKTYGVYALAALRAPVGGEASGGSAGERWTVYRRYSDFHDLHTKVKDKYPDLGRLAFPGKKTFHNMDRSVLERRMRMLNAWLQVLLSPGVMESHPELPTAVAVFLEPGIYDKADGRFAKSLDSLVRSSVRQVGAAVQRVPDSLLSTMDGLVDGLSKVFQPRPGVHGEHRTSRVSASLHAESDDNIPLRIVLLLADEVFDLKSRNQWLRRRIVTLLRQIIRTMFGDIVNRRILDYVGFVTSPEQVAGYLRSFKHAFWPHGVKAEPRAERDAATRLRTRVTAKVALLSSLSDELKHVIGSETARQGVLVVLELFQRRVLNRRLALVLLEGALDALFPGHRLADAFRSLHARSNRVKADAKRAGRR